MTQPRPAIRTSDVVRAWAPLAASWLLMGLELPLVSAVLARLPDPKISLAAYGGVVFPLALLIESPVIMLLSASTALSRDERSYRVGRRVMLTLGIGLTAVHALVAFTPLYDLLVRRVLGVPEEVVEPGRLGLRLMLSWTFSIAYRRFQQGLLIRLGRGREVSIGTAIRLATLASTLAFGAWRGWPGIVVGSMGVTASVLAEAIYAGLRARPARNGPLRQAPAVEPRLTTAAFLRFYFPLMVTPLILFLASPLISAAMSRMPVALDSLATWPALSGLLFTMRGFGFSFNEVVVATMERPGAWPVLRRMARDIALATTTLVVVITATPLAALWLGRVSALPPALVAMGASAMWWGVLLPALSTAQSLYQGSLVHAHATRGVSESMLLYLATCTLVLAAGVAWHRSPGLPVALAAISLAGLVQVAWLRHRMATERHRAPVPEASPAAQIPAV